MNGFQKKTQKTPKTEIEKALKIMTEYYQHPLYYYLECQLYY